MLARDRNRVTFKDVAGVEEAKEEVQEMSISWRILKVPKNLADVFPRVFDGRASRTANSVGASDCR